MSVLAATDVRVGALLIALLLALICGAVAAIVVRYFGLASPIDGLVGLLVAVLVFIALY